MNVCNKSKKQRAATSKIVNEMKKLALPDAIRALGEDFTFGVATSSFQIEGARELRLDCIWDKFCAQDESIFDHSNGDVACDHYHRWQDDLDMMIDLGVDAYRFSIAWPRVMHRDGTLNDDGILFYQKIVEYLKQHNKQAFVTLYHWDLPQFLEDEGGWLNRQTAHAFADYVRVVVQQLGNNVDAYITLNEPYCAGYLGYEVGVHAPGMRDQKAGRQASHHLLLAHGLAMQVIREVAPDTPAGIVLNIHPGYPLNDTEADRVATQMASEYLFYWYLDPLLRGQYPDVMKHLDPCVRPDVEPSDMAIIQAKMDFIGLNYYTRNVYQSDGNDWYLEVDCNDYPKTEMGWEITPYALTEMLVALNQQYELPPLYITENGAAMPDSLVDGRVCDHTRIEYFQSHLNAVAEAISAGVDIKGYFAWSLMDNFEWALGYTKRFGIVYIDYATQERFAKDSALAYRDMLYSRS